MAYHRGIRKNSGQPTEELSNTGEYADDYDNVASKDGEDDFEEAPTSPIAIQFNIR
jgi:hypothetical protein